jgi:hypothetical protein
MPEYIIARTVERSIEAVSTLIRARGEKMKKAVEIFVGIDVSKIWLDVAVHEREETFRAGNEDKGIANLVERMKELKPTLIVIERFANCGGECQTRARFCASNRSPGQDR